MKGKILSFAIMAILCGMLMQSCFITKTPVGAYSSQSGMPMRYSKGKQVWLFGLLPLGRTHINTPATDFMIEGKQTFGDYLISFVTLGIIETRTIKCYVKEYNNGANLYGNNYGTNNNQQVRNDNNYSDDQPVNNSLVGKRVSWQTNQGGTRYGTVTNMRTPSTCEVKTEDTGSTIVITLDKLTKAN